MNFLPVVGWEGIYQVNECGDVISLPRVILRRDGPSSALMADR
jgi:hypothetical protein